MANPLKHNPGFKFEYFTKSINIDGQNIETYVIGSGDDWVFSFPSYPHSGVCYLWFLTHYDLSKVRFVTFDLPGWIGNSDDVPAREKIDLEQYIKIAKEVIKNYQIKKFSVLGYSFGASMALKLAGELHEKIDKIVLVSPVINGKMVRSFLIQSMKIAHKLKLYFLAKVVVKQAWKLYKPTMISEGLPTNFAVIYEQMIQRANPRVLIECVYELFNTDLSDNLEIIKNKKLMVVHSKIEEKIFRDQIKLIKDVIPNDKTIYFHGHHQDFILKPQSEVVKQVVNFLRN